VLITTSFR